MVMTTLGKYDMSIITNKPLKQIKPSLLERMHSYFFGFDAKIQIKGWKWTYWSQYYPDTADSNEGGYIEVFDGIFCFQRWYAV